MASAAKLFSVLNWYLLWYIVNRPEWPWPPGGQYKNQSLNQPTNQPTGPTKRAKDGLHLGPGESLYI